jgi:hypothetical protein
LNQGWLIGGALLGGMLLLSRDAQARVNPGPSFGGDTNRDLDALTRMLLTETSFRKSEHEMAQIVFVAVNRARKQGKPLWFVVQPGRGARPVWNTGADYKRLFEGARTRSNWQAARLFVKKVLAGTSGYRNAGEVLFFIHPAARAFNMPCSRSDWSASHVPGFGTRCIPTWVSRGKVAGSALFA